MYWSGLSAAAAAANAATAYQTGQAGYQVGPTPTSTYAAQRPATTYDPSYQTAAAVAASHAPAAAYAATAATAAYDYTYGRAPQTAAAVAAAYDSTKAYYAQPPAATAYSVAETHYQPKASYTQATAYTAVRPGTAKTGYGGSYQTAAGSAAAGYNASYTNTVGTAANKAMYAPQAIHQANAVSAAKTPNTWQSFKKAGGGMGGKSQRAKPPPKPQQLHYCDVCKISCAGPQTYREHLEGQKHKKKEIAAKAVPAPPSRHGGGHGGASLRCELCDVTCTGNDAYAAHIRGAKHQKVVKLHQKLGKPIPSTDPVVVGTGGNKATPMVVAATPATASTVSTGTAIGSSVPAKQLTAVVGSVGTTVEAVAGNDLKKEEMMKDDLFDCKDVEPVGQEYIEEIKNEEGKVVNFNCKLCECKFNDPNAKEMHMKGRRHRLQYKKKVNPELVVEVKPSLRMRKIQEEKVRRQQVHMHMREDIWRRREEERLEEERWLWEEQQWQYEKECEFMGGYGGSYRGGPRPPPGSPMMPPALRPFGMPGMPPPFRRPDSIDDRHVLTKHSEIYPKEEELGAIQKIVSNSEKALKMVSDYLSEADAPKIKLDELDEKNQEKPKEDGPPRVLKGVMRVGIMAKGFLLKGDTSVELVVLCGEKPTRTMLDRVADNLPKQLAIVAAEEKYEIYRVVEEAAIVVQGVCDPRISVKVTLTSPVVREILAEGGEVQPPTVKDPPDVLDKQKCLDALAALRHAKWFQAKASGLQSCVMIIRIMRDLCQRVPTWAPLNNWAMELLCEKVISSAGQPLSPGDALRRVFETLSSGILLPGSPGLMDPCEKDPMDCVTLLTGQERENITASAQHALRLIAFRQIHKVLGMDAIPPPKFIPRGPRFTRKRRRDNSAGEGNDSEEQDGGDGKKDKKEVIVTEQKMDS